MPNRGHIPELRYKRRFPLELPLQVNGEAKARRTRTHDISAGGVLFYLDSEVAVGAHIEFTISMPAAVLGTPRGVRVICVGRVMRCRKDGPQHAIAAVIDEYQFERA